MFTGKQHPYFRVLRFLLQLLDLPGQLRKDVFPFLSQFDERFQVFDIFRQLPIEFNILFQTASPLQDQLRFLLIVPEFRFGYFLLERQNFRMLVFSIKDTLAPAVFFPRWRSLSPEVLRASIPPKSSIYGPLCDEIP
jgi:hypothetical protein